MRRKLMFLIALLSICSYSFSQGKIIELPLMEHTGYGPFLIGMKGVTRYSEKKENPWINTFMNITKFPEGLTELKCGEIETNTYQSAYQDYLLGNITEEWYKELQKSANWIPDTLNLSKVPLKTKIAFVYGKDKDGNMKLAIDANNNHDLSDDKLFTPIETTTENHFKQDSLAKMHAVTVSYEKFVNGKIRSVDVPLLVMYNSQVNIFMCNFSQHATAEFKGKTIVVNSGMFTDLSYHSVEVAVVQNALMDKDKLAYNDLIRNNEFIEIERDIYKVLGVNTNKNVLMLEQINLPKSQLFSTQVGYRPFPFQGKDSQSKATVSLDNLKGKYVLLDFWAVWCGSCIKEIPNLKELYATTDRSQFEMIGIVGDSPAKQLNALIEKHDMRWCQILSDDENQIKEKYGMNGYPSTFLLDKDGIIIAKDLRGKQLKAKIESLIKNE